MRADSGSCSRTAISASASSRLILTPETFSRLYSMICSERGRRGIRVVGAEVPGERRVEGGAEPVQHDGPAGRAEHLAIHAPVVVGGASGPGEVTARHEHDAGAGVLGVVQLLLVGVDHLVE